MGLSNMKVFKEVQKPKEKIYIERDTAFMKELCEEYQKNKLSKSTIVLFRTVLESMDTLDQVNDKEYIVNKTLDLLKDKFKKNYYEYQIKRMNLDEDDKIMEKFEYYKYYYYKEFQDILRSKFSKVNSNFFTDVSNNEDIILKNDFNKDIITKDNYLKLKQIKLTDSTAKLFLRIFEDNDLEIIKNKNNFVFLITDVLIEKFQETALDYQTSRMGLSTISEIFERIDWFCYFYKEEILKIIYNKTDNVDLIFELRETYNLN